MRASVRSSCLKIRRNVRRIHRSGVRGNAPGWLRTRNCSSHHVIVEDLDVGVRDVETIGSPFTPPNTMTVSGAVPHAPTTRVYALRRNRWDGTRIRCRDEIGGIVRAEGISGWVAVPPAHCPKPRHSRSKSRRSRSRCLTYTTFLRLSITGLLSAKIRVSGAAATCDALT